MFLFKKIAASFLLPPGIFVTLLVFPAVWLFFKGKGKPAAMNFFLAAFIWLLSTTPVSDAMLRGLESGFKIPDSPDGDVIILLGGGVYDGVPDLSGSGSPSEDMAERVITAVRLQKRLAVPVVVSGGKVFREKEAEAPVVRRFLIDLGVPAAKIITEELSRDTMENGRYTAAICARLGFKKPVLVTSAYHMRRAVLSFRRNGLEVIPFPSDFKSTPGGKYGLQDYMPGIRALRNASLAMKEYAGIALYWLAY
jgi:uncharacterized SAM-binding protein YcdF (DUF218 family)